MCRIMKYLNVAEKNDAAKNIAALLSHGTARRREGLSVYNKIYEFSATVRNDNATMLMTSVSGHLLNYKFHSNFKDWHNCEPIALFDAPVEKYCPEQGEKIKRTLQREISSCQGLIIWTDCDREGENIGAEIVQVCKERKRNIVVLRAKFSEITTLSVTRALQNLTVIDDKIVQAVDVRQQLDLRIGAAFTRFQTLRLQRRFPLLCSRVVSYGSCQFPTLGFVVERYKQQDSFVPQDFWKIRMQHTIDELTVDFAWKRDRLFDEMAVQALHAVCQESPEATVLRAETKRKTKWRPLPLDTVEFEKLASRKLKINATNAMKSAEKLYSQGFISYPRTETNIFPNGLDLVPLVEAQICDNSWGNFAQNILANGRPDPRQGKKSDQAHPPIHPLKHTTNLSGNERSVYELVVRHFLACVSKDAVGQETTVEVSIATEGFKATGLCIIERNYLDVYPYDKWNAKEIHHYQVGQKFMPTNIDIIGGATTGPSLLTEADLIALMDKNGIGTDATHAEHINKIKEREYIAEHGIYLVPSCLGMGLVEGYDSVGLPMCKPKLRSSLEANLKLICEGRKNPQDVLSDQIAIYKAAYGEVSSKADNLDDAVGYRLAGGHSSSVPPSQPPNPPRPPPPPQDRPRGGPPDPPQNPPRPPRQIAVNAIGSNAQRTSINSDTNQGPTSSNTNRNTSTSTNTNLSTTAASSSANWIPNPTSTNTRWNTNSTSNTNWDTNISTNTNQNINPPSTSTNPTSTNTRWNTNSTSNTNWDTNISTNTNQNINPPSTSTNWNPNPTNTRWNPTSSTNTNRNNIPATTSGTPETEPPMCSCNIPAKKLTVRKEGPNTGRLFYKCANNTFDEPGCNFFEWISPPNPPDSGIAPTNSMSWGNSSSNSNTTTSRTNHNNDSGAISTSGNNNWGNTGSTNWYNTTADNTGWMTNAPAGNTGSTAANTRWGGSGTAVQADHEVMCVCGNPARRLTVMKDGPNKGKKFYACPKPREEQCTFFKWEDETSTTDTGDGDGPGFPGGGAGHSRGARGSRGGTSTSRGGASTSRGGASTSRGGDYASRGGSSNTAPRGSGVKRKCGFCRSEGHTKKKCPNLSYV